MSEHTPKAAPKFDIETLASCPQSIADSMEELINENTALRATVRVGRDGKPMVKKSPNSDDKKPCPNCNGTGLEWGFDGEAKCRECSPSPISDKESGQ